MKFKAGDLVRIDAEYLDWHGVVGIVNAVYEGAVYPYTVEFKDGVIGALKESELIPADPFQVLSDGFVEICTELSQTFTKLTARVKELQSWMEEIAKQKPEEKEEQQPQHRDPAEAACP
jgi:hypothetical protein